MSRTKKRKARDCRLHGDKACEWCVDNRTYNKRKTEEHSKLDEKEYRKNNDKTNTS